ncbi:MAG: DNA/RNA nuclease SfsA [Eubacterium sp.]|nr:DNA/RNA nuclease SfsA [Eubacterium sp.]
MKPTAIIRYENTVTGTFLRRINRFTAQVMIGGRQETVHVKNTGRLGELLLPGAEITLEKAANPKRKTAWDLISVYKEDLGWVNIDSLAANELMKQLLQSMNYDLVKAEYTYGASRFDFYMERGKDRYLTEVKGCTLAHQKEKATGLFPDAPTVRGLKHLKELTEAARQGYHCTIAFVIQMNGIHTVLPNDATQPEFGRALSEASEAGVKVACHSCHVESDRIWLI